MTVTESITIDELLNPARLHAAYQPIVDLDSREVVGFEALARWKGLTIGPEELFARARTEGRVAELDWACQAAALRGALDAKLGRLFTLFVNLEPSTVGLGVPEALSDLIRDATRDLRVVVELTERALLTRPAELLVALARMRERGWGIALDDVGAVADSLSLLPFVHPDVIKLDLPLVQRWHDLAQAQIITTILAHAERTGATLLAEGIETEAHLEQALALGATLGQGWLFAEAGPLVVPPPARRRIAFVDPPGRTAVTPFDLVERFPDVRIGRKGLLLAFSRQIENQGLSLAAPPVVLAAFQEADRFTAATRRRYARLSAHCPMVVALGAGLPNDLGSGIRGSSLSVGDRLRGEWTVVVVGAQYSGALIARDLGDGGPDLQRRYAFRVTHDRDLVLAAARSLLARVDPDTTLRAPG